MPLTSFLNPPNTRVSEGVWGRPKLCPNPMLGLLLVCAPLNIARWVKRVSAWIKRPLLPSRAAPRPVSTALAISETTSNPPVKLNPHVRVRALCSVKFKSVQNRAHYKFGSDNIHGLYSPPPNPSIFSSASCPPTYPSSPSSSRSTPPSTSRRIGFAKFCVPRMLQTIQVSKILPTISYRLQFRSTTRTTSK